MVEESPIFDEIIVGIAPITTAPPDSLAITRTDLDQWLDTRLVRDCEACDQFAGLGSALEEGALIAAGVIPDLPGPREGGGISGAWVDELADWQQDRLDGLVDRAAKRGRHAAVTTQ